MDAFSWFFSFVGGIGPNAKVLIVRDDDIDGVTAGVQLLKFLQKHRPNAKVDLVFGSPGEVKEELKNKIENEGYDKVFFLDLDVNYDSQKCMIIDHHPQIYKYQHSYLVKPDQITKNVTMDQYCTAKLVFDLINQQKPMPEMKWIASVGLVGDHCEKSWLFFLNNSGFQQGDIKKVAELIDASRTVGGLEALELCHKRLLESNSPMQFATPEILKYKKTLDNEMKTLLNDYKKTAKTVKDLTIFEFESKYEIKSPLSNHISWNICPNNTLLVIHLDKENQKAAVSARRQDRKVDIGKLMLKAIADIPTAVGGGHVPAGGAIVPLKEKDKFLENIRKICGV